MDPRVDSKTPPHVVVLGCGFGGLFAARALAGYPAWVLWLLAHIYFLIGFRNRIVVLIDWTWAHWTFERNARIVFQDKKKGP